jgi:RHS repeat-associated protein
MKSNLKFSFLVMSLALFSPFIFSQTENLVGSIPGYINVNSAGAATYIVPIEIVPGTNGMEPKISIAYNSQSGIGLLGANWQLEGISSIRRIPQNLFINNNITCVNLDLSDRFTLDGNRLIDVQGTYGYDATMYKTELETFREIKSIGNSTVGPTYFEVVDDNGNVYQYGKSDDSRQMLGLVPLAWFVNRITDCEGNYMSFTYNQGLGQIVVSEINYSGNESAALLPYAKISFSYNNNNLNNTCYIRGQGYVRSKLLDAISTYYNGTLVKKYSFIYDHTRVPRLNIITLTGENSKQINPTIAEWGPSVPDTSSYITDVEGAGYFPIRYDGDNCTDFFYCNPSTKSTAISYGWRIISNDCEGNLGEDIFGSIDNYLLGFPADVNGDGKDEVVYEVWDPDNNVSFHYLEFDIENFTYNEVDMNLTFGYNTISQILPGDLNGDGKDDIIFYTPSKNPKLTFWGLNDGIDHTEIVLSNEELLVQDNNNNRKAEIMIDRGATTSIYEYDNITKKFKFYVTDPIVQMGNSYVYYGDFNDDGLKDVLRISKSGTGNNHSCYVNINVNSTNSMWSSFGTLMPLEITFNSQTNLILTPPLIGDMNGDKRDDIIVTVKQPDSKIRLDVFYSDGYMNNQFLYHKISYLVNSFTQPNTINENYYYCTDMNGDGCSDILYVQSNSRKINLFFHKGEQFELLRRVANGFGAMDSLSYVMSYSPYTYYTSNFESRIYFPLVSELYSYNGLSNNSTRNSFEYYDVLYSLNRSKFFGFSTVKSTDHTNGLKQSDTYSMNTTFDNVDLVNRSYYQYGHTLKETFTPAYFNWGNVFLSYNDIYEKSDYITGVKTNTNTNVYSDGRIQNVFTRNFRIDKDVFLSSTNIAYQYQDIELPNTLTVKKLKSNVLTEQITGSTESLQYSTTYNYLSGRLDNIIITNNSSPITKTTTYSSYNSFGSPTSIINSATDVASQTEQIVYDVTGRFVASRTNALGHISSSTYYGGTGNINTSTDVNGLITSYFYDEFGRERLVQYPDGTSANITRQWRQQTAFLPNVVYSVNTTATTSPSKAVFYDKLSREVFSYVEVIGYKQTVYNAKGQIEKESLPFVLLNTSENNKIWTSYTYDPQGKISTEIGPYLNNKYTYDGINSDKTNHTVSDLLRNTSVIKSYDLPDRIVQVEEDAGGIINYGYEFKKIDDNLSKVQTITCNSNTTTLVYDLNGNLKLFNDPSSGKISSSFDAFNRIVSKTDAKSNQTTYQYDLLDRVIIENHSGGSEAALKFEYTYDVGSSKSKGKLFCKTINNVVDELYYYDDLSRMVNRKKMINSTLYIESFGYNNIGQLYTYTFPDGLRVRYGYNNFGELSNIYDDGNNTLICAIGRNNFRKHSGLAFNNQTGIKYLYNSYGMLTEISSGDIEVGSQLNEIGGDEQNTTIEGSPSSIGDQYRALKYLYNTKGLIERREDTRVNQYETYVYDNLDRLTSYTSGTIQPISANTVTYGINPSGNITSNTQVGNYSYGEKPFAVELINYFANCPISHSTCSTPFNNRNLPASITEGIYSYSIDYGSDGNRRSAVLKKTENGVNTVIKSTCYISPACEIEITPSGTKFIDYIFTDQGVAAIRTKEGTKLNMHYVHTDHLGSYNFVMDAGKNIVQSCHFDPWGNRKLYNNWLQNNMATSFLFSRGYTSHEHLDVFKIINMNARLYDPVIGRFFSPDPVIQDFEATQSLNRYSYCQNNPVNRVDLDGRVASPVFDNEGNLLGTDEYGWHGEIIIADNASKFKSGMKHEDAMKLGRTFSKNRSDISDQIKIKIIEKVLEGTELPDNTKISLDKINLTLYDDPNGNGDYNNGWINLDFKNDDDWSVDNIRMVGGIHEFYGHGIKRWGDRFAGGGTHRKCYEAEIDSKYWNRSTYSFKSSTVEKYWNYYWFEVYKMDPSRNKSTDIPLKYREMYLKYRTVIKNN